MARLFDATELEQLITCSKRVQQPPRRDMISEGKMLRNDMTLVSSDGRHAFRAFFRISQEFRENFSLGLIYILATDPGSFVLLRCNGQHGGTVAHPHHAHFHIHRCSAEDLNQGILEPRRIELTTAYASFIQAQIYFLNTINLEDRFQYFPKLQQGNLFPEDIT